MARVCVFCGGNPGRAPYLMDAARALGDAIARSGAGLVYGGARGGLMGAVADAALAAGGEVLGVLPSVLSTGERPHRGLTRLFEVGSMHERKAKMAELSDAFVALPGGFGTLDELFEVVTWAQIGLHQKPCVLYNLEGYYDGLLAFLDHAEQEGLLRPEYRPLLRPARALGEVMALVGKPG